VYALPENSASTRGSRYIDCSAFKVEKPSVEIKRKKVRELHRTAVLATGAVVRQTHFRFFIPTLVAVTLFL
jgi:hypothetical protein